MARTRALTRLSMLKLDADRLFYGGDRGQRTAEGRPMAAVSGRVGVMYSILLYSF